MAESSVDRLNEIISRSEEKFFSGLERRFIGMDLNFRKGQIKSEVEHFAKMLSLFPHDGGKVHDKFFTRFERTLNVESKGYLSPEDKGSVVLEMVGVCVNTFFDLIDKYNGKNRNLRDGFRLALRKVIRIGAETYGRASGNEIDKKFISELEARVLRGQITRGEIKEILDMGFVRPDKTQELGKPE